MTAGIFHSQIWDTSSGNQLLNTFTTLAGWNPADAALFDAFSFFGGDGSVDDTLGNIGVIDNVNIVAVTTPEPGTLALLAGGLIPLAGALRRRRTRN